MPPPEHHHIACPVPGCAASWCVTCNPFAVANAAAVAHVQRVHSMTDLAYAAMVAPIHLWLILSIGRARG